jgi:hypothetical protein
MELMTMILWCQLHVELSTWQGVGGGSQGRWPMVKGVSLLLDLILVLISGLPPSGIW